MLKRCYDVVFNDTATTEIYTLSLHDALPIYVDRPDEDQQRRHVGEPAPDRPVRKPLLGDLGLGDLVDLLADRLARPRPDRSEEHTSELQSRQYLVCRLLLEKKTTRNIRSTAP